MNLCIDIGNTRTKAAVFSSAGQIIFSEKFSENILMHIQQLVSTYAVQNMIVTSSGSIQWNPDDIQIPGRKILLSHTTPLPVRLLYSTPETLGRDRIASVCGAQSLFPDQHLLVIDCGTCLTTNMLLSSGSFIGGTISPGLNMRLKAMHEMTASLPLVSPGWPDEVFGTSTLHAMQLGAGAGMLAEIDGMIKRAKNAFGDVSVVMTGGDAAFLADKLECRIFVEPELVVKGLFKILSLNVQ